MGYQGRRALTPTPRVLNPDTGAVEWVSSADQLFRLGVPLLGLLVLALSVWSVTALWRWRKSKDPALRAKGLVGATFLLLVGALFLWLGLAIAQGMVVGGLR